MNITTKYLFHVIGEDTTRRYHSSTINRIKAFAIAIHIPVALWAVTGYVIASHIFMLEPRSAFFVSLICASLIYLVERLVIAAPKVWFVNLGRLMMGVVIAILGASTVDLVIFDREINQQLIISEKNRITKEFDITISEQTKIVNVLKSDWLDAQAAANCEANGTCGSGVKSIGPIYKELAKQAENLRLDYLAATKQLDELKINKYAALDGAAQSATIQAGLLARIEALHAYTVENKLALSAWILFFALVLIFELMVVFAKLVFGETVDDVIEQVRESVNQHKAQTFMETTTSPLARAARLIDTP